MEEYLKKEAAKRSIEYFSDLGITQAKILASLISFPKSPNDGVWLNKVLEEATSKLFLPEDKKESYKVSFIKTWNEEKNE